MGSTRTTCSYGILILPNLGSSRCSEEPMIRSCCQPERRWDFLDHITPPVVLIEEQ